MTDVSREGLWDGVHYPRFLCFLALPGSSSSKPAIPARPGNSSSGCFLSKQSKPCQREGLPPFRSHIPGHVFLMAPLTQSNRPLPGLILLPSPRNASLCVRCHFYIQTVPSLCFLRRTLLKLGTFTTTVILSCLVSVSGKLLVTGRSSSCSHVQVLPHVLSCSQA